MLLGMMPEAFHDRRSAPRHKVLKSGKLILPQSSALVDVVVRELSLTGARISSPATADLPAAFDLYLPGDDIRIPSEVCWHAAGELGIRFMALARPFTQAQAAAAETPKGDNANTGIPAAHRLTPAPDVAALHIHPDFRLGYETHPLASDRGDCLVEISLTNHGEFDAHHPFICLPLLGLRVVPADGWDMREVTSVRRMLRLGSLRASVLEPGASVHCCTVKLPFTSVAGAELEYETGNRHPVAALPDLRLTCIAGAGNYPTGRLPLIVPAGGIQGFLQILADEGRIPAAGGRDGG